LKITKDDFDYVENFKLKNTNIKEQLLNHISSFNYSYQEKIVSGFFNDKNCLKKFSKMNEKYELLRNILF
jgi:hypothetical protein